MRRNNNRFGVQGNRGAGGGEVGDGRQRKSERHTTVVAEGIAVPRANSPRWARATGSDVLATAT